MSLTRIRRPGTIARRRNVGITAVGMDKVGNQSLPDGLNYYQVTNWSTRAGFGSPVGDTLVASAPGIVIISGVITFPSLSNEKSVQIKKNGVAIFTTPKVTNSVQAFPFAVHDNANANDVYTVWISCGNVNGSVQASGTYATMKEQVFALTATHSDNFDRANATSLGASWGYASSLATADISSNRAIGSGDANCRASFQTTPSASRTGQFFKLDIVGINSRVGLVYNSNSGSDSTWAVLSNATTLLLGATASTTSSASGTVQSTITVPTVTPPKEMLVLMTSDNTADVFIDRIYAGTHYLPNLYGLYGGLYAQAATDIVDNYSQGTWAA